MIPEEHLMTAMIEDEFFLEHLIYDLKKSWVRKQDLFTSTLPELECWLVRTGLSPASYLSQNRIGFYTEFT